jgi:hypothetical protein
VTLAAGTYLVVFNGEFAEDDNDLGDFLQSHYDITEQYKPATK